MQNLNSIWNADKPEKERIRAFWLDLSEYERKQLVKLEKEAVLKKIKEQQKQACSCSVCGRKRSVIEEELEILYDAYYEELENFANDQAKGQTNPHPHSQLRNFSKSIYLLILNLKKDRRYHHSHHHDEEDEEDSEDEYDQESEENGSMHEFGSSLTVKGGILTVADDFLKNDGKKFLDLMEQLAEKKMRQMDDENNDSDWGRNYDEEEDEEDEEYEDEDEALTEEQRMEEGRRMFQIFAAKMFEQRVLAAYREKVAQECAAQLLNEEAERERQLQLREEKKQKLLEKKRLKKKLEKQKKDEEKERLERERQIEEERIRVEKEKALEAERQRREAERQKKETERLKREEAERIKREAERLKKEEEKRKQKEAEDRKRQLKEEKERKIKEKEELEKKLLKEKEEQELKQIEEYKKKVEEKKLKELELKKKRELEEKKLKTDYDLKQLEEKIKIEKDLIESRIKLEAEEKRKILNNKAILKQQQPINNNLSLLNQSPVQKQARLTNDAPTLLQQQLQNVTIGHPQHHLPHDIDILQLTSPPPASTSPIGLSNPLPNPGYLNPSLPINTLGLPQPPEFTEYVHQLSGHYGQQQLAYNQQAQGNFLPFNYVPVTNPNQSGFLRNNNINELLQVGTGVNNNNSVNNTFLQHQQLPQQYPVVSLESSPQIQQQQIRTFQQQQLHPLNSTTTSPTLQNQFSSRFVNEMGNGVGNANTAFFGQIQQQTPIPQQSVGVIGQNKKVGLKNKASFNGMKNVENESFFNSSTSMVNENNSNFCGSLALGGEVFNSNLPGKSSIWSFAPGDRAWP
ncbi:Stress response protein nst1 [Clydaea vesicula]|uniref:Stress response protein NST1 n=1 Tax=Clydaea vesicula TaxID=447962 RepID=A0AAD5XXQ6_9FUNG|nr:Stress response protein nst1 [Clydaea vesicula]